MKNKPQFLLLLIGISFFSCNSAVKNPDISISNINTDFPVTEKLEFKPVNTFDILKQGFRIADDSILWSFEEGESDFGSCYNIHTGEKLATIASRGRAANELTQLESFKVTSDSVLLYTVRNTIKSFAKKDIIDNIPMGDRKFTVTTVPDSILVSRMTKLPNGSVLATIQPALEEYQQNKISEFNQKTVALFNNKEANSYETIDYESFDIEEAKEPQLATNDLIKCAYSDGAIEVKGNDMAVFSVHRQFILYTFDLKSGNVVNEKRYSKMQRSPGGNQSSILVTTTNDRRLSIGIMKTNDKYILCTAYGYFSEEDKDAKLSKGAVFVFDWELNPIKKFALPDNLHAFYSISNNCKSIHYCESKEDGLTLYKADLNY